MECNKDCSCDYVKYNPVCSENGEESFISACHAGCKRQELVNGTKMFFDCTCINSNNEARFERLLSIPGEVYTFNHYYSNKLRNFYCSKMKHNTRRWLPLEAQPFLEIVRWIAIPNSIFS